MCRLEYLSVIHMHTLMRVCTCAQVLLHVHVKSFGVGDGRSAEGCVHVCVRDLLHCSVDVCACVYTQVILRSVCFRLFDCVHGRVFQARFPSTCSAVIETWFPFFEFESFLSSFVPQFAS